MENGRAGLSSYDYCSNNPVMRHDPDGKRDKKKPTGVQASASAEVGTGAKPTAPAALLTPAPVIKDGQLNAADNNNVKAKIDDEKKVKMAEDQKKKRLYELSKPKIMTQGRFGNVHTGTAEEVELKERIVNMQYADQVLSNIAGGFFGALGYYAGGEEGSFVGAEVDNAAAAVVALGELGKGRYDSYQGPISLNERERTRRMWEKPPIVRGFEAEKKIGGDLLPPGFKTIDKFDFKAGIAISIKSIDLKSQTFSNLPKLEKQLTNYVDKVAAFMGGKKAGVFIFESQIKGRELHIAIQWGATSIPQYRIFGKIGLYSENVGVKLRIFELK